MTPALLDQHLAIGLRVDAVPFHEGSLPFPESVLKEHGLAARVRPRGVAHRCFVTSSETVTRHMNGSLSGLQTRWAQRAQLCVSNWSALFERSNHADALPGE